MNHRLNIAFFGSSLISSQQNRAEQLEKVLVGKVGRVIA